MKTHNKLGWAAVVLSTVLLAACGGGGGGDDTTIERALAPAEINPAINTATEDHIAVTPSTEVELAHKLFVFLPGTKGTPDMYKMIVREGAQRGYHTIGINYPNPEAVGQICARPLAGSDCFWNVRREVITGQDLTTFVEVDAANSIVGRLRDAIRYLAEQHPDEGWEEYLDGDNIVWSKVIISGHSQGGGHAGVMTKLYSMARAVYFASPADWDIEADAPAAWVNEPNVTPASRQFAFANLLDDLVPWEQLQPILVAMGLAEFGEPKDVDVVGGDYGGSHILYTEVEPDEEAGNASPTHGSMVLDVVTPTEDGEPEFENVWSYLAFYNDPEED